MGYVYVGLTIIFTVYGQLVIKWQLGDQTLPEPTPEKLKFLLLQLLNPWVFSGFAAAFLAALSWMAAMTKLPLSKTYPFTSIALVLVVITSHVFLGEELTIFTWGGVVLIAIGICLISQ